MERMVCHWALALVSLRIKTTPGNMSGEIVCTVDLVFGTSLLPAWFHMGS